MAAPQFQIPSSNAVIAPAINALVAARPGALKHINYGTGAYSHLIEGWRAQAALVISRLADQAIAGHEIAQRPRVDVHPRHAARAPDLARRVAGLGRPRLGRQPHGAVVEEDEALR